MNFRFDEVSATLFSDFYGPHLNLPIPKGRGRFSADDSTFLLEQKPSNRLMSSCLRRSGRTDTRR
jgi:hypothetical protein